MARDALDTRIVVRQWELGCWCVGYQQREYVGLRVGCWESENKFSDIQLLVSNQTYGKVTSFAISWIPILAEMRW